MSRITRRRGITLIEMLVTLGVIGMLASLLLPAVQSAREAARRSRCANNMKQFGIALHHYEGAWGVFPPSPMSYSFPQFNHGTFTRGCYFSAHTALLRYLEQGSVYDTINFQVVGSSIGDIEFEGANLTALRQHIETFTCPSDSWANPAPYGPTNYRANFGICGYCRDGIADGAFTRTGVRLAAIADGLSNTLAVSEKLVGGAPAGRFRPNRDWIAVYPDVDLLAISASAWVEACSSRVAGRDDRFMRYDAGRTWMLGGPEFTHFLVSVPPNSPVPDCGAKGADGKGVFAARSLHPGGVNVTMADASVRFVTNQIDAQAWRGLGTRHGGEVVSPLD